MKRFILSKVSFALVTLVFLPAASLAREACYYEGSQFDRQDCGVCSCPPGTMKTANGLYSVGTCGGILTDYDCVRSQSKSPTLRESSSAADCSNPATSYLSVRPGRKEDGLDGGGYVIENSCKSSAIEVRYVTLTISCKQESNVQVASRGGYIPDYSYCNTPPQIISAKFTK